MASRIAVIFGAGPRTGNSIAQKFTQDGYKVAVVSRGVSEGNTPEGFFGVKADFADPETVPGVFNKVKAELGIPNVVIYNAATTSMPPDPDNLLSLPWQVVEKDTRIDSVSAYVAAQQAVAGFSQLAEDVPKSFIFTGNLLNTITARVPIFLTLGVGKSAAAYWIGAASAAYASKGYKFYYVDERLESGEAIGFDISGDAHADFYFELASGEKDIPWHATFVKGAGYKKFKRSIGLKSKVLS